MKKAIAVVILTCTLFLGAAPHIHAEFKGDNSIAYTDYVTFGHYEQDNNLNNGSEPIEWMVLDFDSINNRVLLISRYALDARPYNSQNVDMTWETCSLRHWLNHDFFNTAFSTAEQKAIKITHVDNSRNQGYSTWDTDGGNDTEDLVFLLSCAEAEKYFNVTWENTKNKRSRVAPTAYAIQNHAWTMDDRTADGKLSGFWWLRSPGGIQNYAAAVHTDGSLSYPPVMNGTASIRPVVWIDSDFSFYPPEDSLHIPVEQVHEDDAVMWYNGGDEVYNSLGEHFFYKIVDNHAILTKYCVDEDKEQPSNVTIPSMLNGYSLIAIDYSAFNSVTRVYGSDADGEEIDCLIIPEGVEILLPGAFNWAYGIQRIELPSTLSNILTDGMTFERCTAEISFPNGNPNYSIQNGFLVDQRNSALLYCNPTASQNQLPRVARIEARALENYSGYQEVLEFPDSVIYIGSYNAYDCSILTEIIVPSSTVELADHALECNSAERIILNEGLQKIGSWAFADTEIESITIPSTVTWIGYEPFGWWEPDEIILLNPDSIVWESEDDYSERAGDE